MPYTEQQMQQIYSEYKTISEHIGTPVVSIDELTKYMNDRQVELTQYGIGSKETKSQIKDFITEKLGGADQFGADFDKIEEASAKELKEVAAAAEQKEKKLNNDLEHQKVREAQEKAKNGQDKQIEDDKKRQEYLPSEERKQVPGRGSWNPARISMQNKTFGSRVERQANIAYPEKLSDQVSLKESKDIECKTKDGILSGHRYVPENPNGKVVLFFGGSHAPGSVSVKKNTEQFIKDGTTVVNFDPRGFGKSQTLNKSGKPVETRLSEEGMYKDAQSMFSYVVKEMGVKPENIILQGSGMGKNIASRLEADVEKLLQSKSAGKEQEVSGPKM